MAEFNNIASFSEDGVGLMLHVLLFEEDGVIAAYAPALDLFGYGNTEDEARSSFQLVLEEFMIYTTENHTLEAELEKFGWDVKSDSERPTPPTLIQIIERNPVAANIYNHKDYTAKNQPIHAFG